MSRRLSHAVLLGFVFLTGCKIFGGNNTPSTDNLAPPGHVRHPNDRRQPDPAPERRQPDPAPPRPLAPDLATPMGVAITQGRAAIIIGDSHSTGDFGKALYDKIKAKGSQTFMFAVCGANAAWWLNAAPNAPSHTCGYLYRHPANGRAEEWAPTSGDAMPAPRHQAALHGLMAHANTQLVILALGANADTNLVQSGSELVKKIPSDKPCFWVSPPPVPANICSSYNRPDFAQTFARLKAASGRDCTLVDSTAILNPAAHSGCHFAGPCAKYWGEAVAAKITGDAPPTPPANCAPPTSH